LVLGEVEETIYVIEEDEDEEETVKVSFAGLKNPLREDTNLGLDNKKAVRNAFCSRYNQVLDQMESHRTDEERR